MPRVLIYAPEALADLDAARAWLTQPGSGPIARHKLIAIRASIRQLKEHPCQWPVGDIPGTRELLSPAGIAPSTRSIQTPAAMTHPATCGCCGFMVPGGTEEGSPAMRPDETYRRRPHG